MSNKLHDFLIVIPARLDSTRLGRKALAMIGEKPMIVHTVERALEATLRDNIIVATDSPEIKEICERFDINVVMTSAEHKTGTDRIAEVAERFPARCYINLQGDEPIMDPENIKIMIRAAIEDPKNIINGWAFIENEVDYYSLTIPKVVLKQNNDLLYMSRAPIPGNKSGNFKGARKQVCIYSFPASALSFLRQNKNKTLNEEIEDIEILRFCDTGWRVKMIELPGFTVAVDTESDLLRVRKINAERSNN